MASTSVGLRVPARSVVTDGMRRPPFGQTGRVLKWRHPPKLPEAPSGSHYTEVPSVLSSEQGSTPVDRAVTDTTATLLQRPMRADARRNYEKLIAAAREAFTEDDSSASLEDIARRAHVGIGTLYRHFPTRRHLLEAVYVDEVEATPPSAAELQELPPWDALAAWLRRFVGYAATKRALAQALFTYVDRDAEVFQACRESINGAGEPLLRRAQEAHVVRPDVT